ncbi:MAG: zf-HC2 domain-containing protein [Gemmatimonadaceae bacterium]|nr:zf-HC2 domain-containing protein [Gemmatimonadaceae bacterium]
MPRRPSISCREFRRQHVEYVDGFLVGDALMACERHLDQCDACRRHDTLIRRSLLALQALPTITPSPDFGRRLQARLAADSARLVPIPARGIRWGIAAAMLAASVALLIAAPKPAPSGGTVKMVRMPAMRVVTPTTPTTPAAFVASAPAVVALTADSTNRPAEAQRAHRRANASTGARFEALPGQAPLRTAPSAGTTSSVRLQAVTYVGQ